MEEILKDTGLSYAIIRPTLVFGEGDLLLNNMAWALRRFPVFPSLGAATTRCSPSTLRTSRPRRWMPVPAVTVSLPTPPGRIHLHSRNCCGCWPRRWAPASAAYTAPSLGFALTRVVGLLLRDTVLSRDEVDGLMAGLLTSDGTPTGTTRLADWLDDNSDRLGRRYVCETAAQLWSVDGRCGVLLSESANCCFPGPPPTSSEVFGVDWITDKLAQEVLRGMREAATRGFWMTTYAPYGYKRVYVQDGIKKRPKLELNPPADAVVRRVFDMVLQGKSILDVTKTLNAEGIPTTNGKKWLKTTIHTMLDHEAYTGTLVWGAKAKDGAPPVRVEDAHPAIVSKRDFQKARKLLASRAPKKMNPRRASSPYLLSGLVKCETCGKAMTAAEAKSGRYTYYICHSLLKRGKGTCETPRLNAQEL